MGYKERLNSYKFLEKRKKVICICKYKSVMKNVVAV